MIQFAVFMVLMAAAGGGWMLNISNKNSGDAAVGYAIVGVIWSVACVIIAATAALK